VGENSKPNPGTVCPTQTNERDQPRSRLGRIPGSFDAIAGPLTAMFDVKSKKAKNTAPYLDPTTGQIVK
jgi:hypothetical protein